MTFRVYIYHSGRQYLRGVVDARSRDAAISAVLDKHGMDPINRYFMTAKKQVRKTGER